MIGHQQSAAPYAAAMHTATQMCCCPVVAALRGNTYGGTNVVAFGLGADPVPPAGAAGRAFVDHGSNP